MEPATESAEAPASPRGDNTLSTSARIYHQHSKPLQSLISGLPQIVHRAMVASRPNGRGSLPRPGRIGQARAKTDRGLSDDGISE
jgi:hypothetical protein